MEKKSYFMNAWLLSKLLPKLRLLACNKRSYIRRFSLPNMAESYNLTELPKGLQDLCILCR
jgi:hypothetical protein